MFQRLSGFQIFSPELRDRREDIWPLTQHFLIKHRQNHPVASVSVERQAIAFLEGQLWPGNVRELENAVYNAALSASGRPIRLEHVQQVCITRNRVNPAPLRPLREPPTDLFEKAKSGRIKNVHAQVMEQAERSLFKRAFDIAAGNQSKIARWLGLTRKTVRAKLRQFKLGSSHRDGLDVDPE